MHGLCGAHRTGKTTLAKAYAEKHGALFVETSVSAIFKDLGHDPADTFDFKTRLDIQEEVLKRVDAIYGCVPIGVDSVTDRTPLDMLGYTMAEAIGGNVRDEDQQRFERYVRDCFDVTNRRFATVTLVQPGIPLKHEQGKAVLNRAYIEHLNSLILGLTVDMRLKAAHFYIPRHYLSLEERIEALEGAQRQTVRLAHHAVRDHVEAGGMLH